jgi:hypothetical protein
MMEVELTAYISEHHGAANYYRQGLVHAPLASYALSSSTGSHVPGANTDFILVTADAGMLLSIAASSTVTLTSTNAIRIPANVPPIPIAVYGSGAASPSSIVAAST